GSVEEYGTARSVGFHFPGLVEEARGSVTLPNHEQGRRSDGTQCLHADVRLMINGLLRTTSGRAYRDGCSDRTNDRGTVADKQFGAIVTAIDGEVALPDFQYQEGTGLLEVEVPGDLFFLHRRV